MSELPAPSRRAAREAALQALYGAVLGDQSILKGLEASVEETPLAEESEAFARQLAEAAFDRHVEWEEVFVIFFAPGWSLDRIAWIDRLVLTLACAELWIMPAIPPKVTINEMVRLAKKYGGRDSSSFVNGVLGNVLKASPKAQWTGDFEEVFEPEPVIEEPEMESLVEGDPEVEKLMKVAWVLKSEGKDGRPL